MRVTVTGIPSHWHRGMNPSSSGHPHYREIEPLVRTWDDVLFSMRSIANTGNYLIGEGVPNLFAAHDVRHIPWSWLIGEDREYWTRYINDNCDMLVFAAANLFNPIFDTRMEALVFSSLKIPVVIMSAGIQDESFFGESYPETFTHLMDALRRSNVFTFTRGNYTADFLRGHGANWVEAVGCPSIYFRPDNLRKSLRELPLLDPSGDLDINHSGYLGSVEDTIVDVNALGGGGRAWYTVQDEPLLFKYEPSEDSSRQVIYDDVSGEFQGDITFPGSNRLSKSLTHRVFFNTYSWRSEVRMAELSIGRRFHGNLIAGQAGVPFVMILVDDRMREMNELAGFPAIEARLWNLAPNKVELLTEIVRKYDARAAIDRYDELVSRMDFLLRSLGVNPSSLVI